MAPPELPGLLAKIEKATLLPLIGLLYPTDIYIIL